MGAILLTVLTLLAFSYGSPVPNKLKYDQKQEGKWNVRADLENFIILLIPTSSSGGSSSAANTSLLDFLSKTIPLPSHKFPKKHQKNHQQHIETNLPDTEEFIESKTAPYHVDISHTRSHLAKLYPEVDNAESVKEEIIIARSPSVALSKSQESADRSSRAILFSVPMENEHVQRHDIKGVVGKVGEESKKTVGLSAAAIEKGLEEQFKNNGIKIQKPFEEEPASLNTENFSEKFSKMTPELKSAYATVIAKSIQDGLIEYFRKLSQQFKERAQNDDDNELPEKVHKEEKIHKGKDEKFMKEKGEKMQKEDKIKEEKIQTQEEQNGHMPSALTHRIVKIVQKVKERVDMKNNSNYQVPNIELEPPKMEMEEPNKVEDAEKPTKPVAPKEELLLLGAMHEQCGPGLERDPSGICIVIKS